MREPLRTALGDLLRTAEIERASVAAREQAAARLAEAVRRLFAERDATVINPAAFEELGAALAAWDAGRQP